VGSQFRDDGLDRLRDIEQRNFIKPIIDESQKAGRLRAQNGAGISSGCRALISCWLVRASCPDAISQKQHMHFLAVVGVPRESTSRAQHLIIRVCNRR
jgi:hypothetical protein